jgi:hypothetical protein
MRPQNRRDPEITDLEEVRGRYQNVRTPEIPMDATRAVQDAQTVKDLQEEAPDRCLGQWPVLASAVINHVPEVLELRIFGQDAETLLITEGFVKSDDERRGERCHDMNLIDHIIDFAIG